MSFPTTLDASGRLGSCGLLCSHNFFCSIAQLGNSVTVVEFIFTLNLIENYCHILGIYPKRGGWMYFQVINAM